MRKGTADINIPVTSTYYDRNYFIYQNNKYASLENKEVELVLPVQMSI